MQTLFTRRESMEADIKYSTAVYLNGFKTAVVEFAIHLVSPVQSSPSPIIGRDVDVIDIRPVSLFSVSEGDTSSHMPGGFEAEVGQRRTTTSRAKIQRPTANVLALPTVSSSAASSNELYRGGESLRGPVFVSEGARDARVLNKGVASRGSGGRSLPTLPDDEEGPKDPNGFALPAHIGPMTQGTYRAVQQMTTRDATRSTRSPSTSVSSPKTPHFHGPDSIAPSTASAPLPNVRTTIPPPSGRVSGRRKGRYSDPTPSSRHITWDNVHSRESVLRGLDQITHVNLGELYDWQYRDLMTILERERAILHLTDDGARGRLTGSLVKWDTGMGKTILTIALIATTRQELESPTLILCTNSTMMHQWRKEIKTFAPTLEVLFYHAEDSSTEEIEEMLPEEIFQYDVVLATYDRVRLQHGGHTRAVQDNSTGKSHQLGPLHHVFWGRVVADESHKLSNPDSLRTKACLALRRRVSLLLSATPVQNCPRDLYAQFSFIGREDERLRNVKSWCQDNIQTKLKAALREVCIYRPKISRRGEAYVTLPSRTDHKAHIIELTDEERAVYNCVLDVYAHEDTFTMLTRLRQASLEPRLLLDKLYIKRNSRSRRVQTSQGIGTLAHVARPNDGLSNGRSDIRLELPPDIKHIGRLFSNEHVSTKISEALSMLWKIFEKSPNEKTIVFSHFKGPLNTISQALSARGVLHSIYNGDVPTKSRPCVLDAIKNDQRYMVLLMTIQSGGVGLNITSCNHVILLDPWWNPYLEEQAIGRVHRIGQEKPVHVYRIIAKNTIESENMVPLQEKKRIEIENLFRDVEVDN